MLVTPEAWVPGSPTALQTRFLDLAVLAAAGTEIAFAGYNPAILLASVPAAGANTGNGTMSSVSLLAAVAETWTITATSATNFTVTGSVSGAQAAATVGSAYKNTKVVFAIMAGTTPFIAGDSFTFSVALTNPETGIIADGYAEYYKETTAALNEVIYTK